LLFSLFEYFGGGNADAFASCAVCVDGNDATIMRGSGEPFLGIPDAGS
jgi:hypothetical protein